MPRTELKFYHSRVFLILTILFGLGVIGYLSYQTSQYLQAKENEAGEVAFEKAYVITKAKVNSYIYGLQGMGGVYLSLNFGVIPEDVRRYAAFRHFFKNFPGSLGYGFIRYIPKDKFASYEPMVRKQIPHFKVRRLSDQQFDDYMVIEVIEPIEHNRSAQGLDVGSEPHRREAAWSAALTGEPVMTHQIQLVQADEKGPGFLFYLPLYKSGVTPTTVEERKREIVGWSYTPILASAIGNHLKESVDSRLNFAIDELETPEKPHRIFGDESLKNFSYSRVLLIGGRTWMLNANYENDLLSWYRRFLPVTFFFFASGLYIAICLYIQNLLLSRRATEIRAEKIETQLATLINGASFAIIATNPEGVITTFNSAAQKMLGYAQDEVIGKMTPRFFHDTQEMIERARILSRELGMEVAPNFDVFTLRASRYDVDVHEWTYIRKDGSRFPARLVVTPIYSKNQELEGYLGIAEDITEINQMRDTIEQQREKMIASAKLSSLGEMAGGIAHEINNPLAIITSKIKLLEQKLSKKEMDLVKVQEELLKIDKTTQRIATIVRGLKAFSRESTKDPKETIPLSTIIRDTLDLCAEKFKHYHVDLRVLPYKDVSVNCRPTQISQVLLNLLGNSFDAVVPLAEKWIEIRVEVFSNRVLLSVVDSGKGIPEAVVLKMMHPFFTTKEVGKGTGLGLSISKGLIEDHGGKFYYDANSANTRFVIDLPLEGA